MKKAAKIAKVLCLVFPVVFVFLSGGERAAAAPGFSPAPAEFCLQVEIRNNLWSPDQFYRPVAEEEILQLRNIPPAILAREALELRLPAGRNKEWGFSYRQAGWMRVTGESAAFYRDALEGTEPRRYYTLGFNIQSYNRLGLYALRHRKQPGMDFILRGDLFLCPDYEAGEAAGQGRLLAQSDGSYSVEIYGIYHRVWTEAGAPPGIGAGLTWEARLEWGAGTGLGLLVSNLPGLVYFPRLTREDKVYDSKKESIGPIYVSGKKKRGAGWMELPLELAAVLFRPAGPGRLWFAAAGAGAVRDFSAGYHYPFTDKYTIMAELNPVMGYLALGWLWRGGEIRFYLDRSTAVFLKGATVTVWK